MSTEKVVEEVEEPPAEPAGPPEPEPGSDEWEYVGEPIDKVRTCTTAELTTREAHQTTYTFLNID